MNNFSFDIWYNNHKLERFGIKNPLSELKNKNSEADKMTNIKESAEQYEPKKTKNIADLDKINVLMDIKCKTVNEGTDNEFSYEYIIVDEVEYRVPLTVLKQLKEILKKKPDMTEFSVSKSGEGLDTSYTVIPM